MSGFGPSVAVGNCWVCARKFLFDPDEVAVVYVDPITGKPPHPDDAVAVARSKRRQVCYRCAKNVAKDRDDLGLPDLWQGNWGKPDDD
jgi:hypothetical protein